MLVQKIKGGDGAKVFGTWLTGGFLPVQVKQLLEMGWTRLLCPVWDTWAGAEHGARYGWGEDEEWAPLV